MKKTLEIMAWKTIEYPCRKFKSVEIIKCNYKKGYYFMEGIDGYIFYKITKPITIQCLKINGSTWMVDDPCHWIGMQRLAEHSRGRVLVGGLGMGIVIHHLLSNKDISKIDVVECNKDVINLVSPLFNDEKITIHNDNIKSLKWLKNNVYDTIILDIWTYNRYKDNNGLAIWAEMQSMVYSFRNAHPNADVFVWGLRDKEMNPAINLSENELLLLADFSKGD